MDFLVLNIRLIEGDEGLHPVAIRYEENGVQYERLTSAEEIIRLLKKAGQRDYKKEHEENLKNWDVRAEVKLLDELPNIKAEGENSEKTMRVDIVEIIRTHGNGNLDGEITNAEELADMIVSKLYMRSGE